MYNVSGNTYNLSYPLFLCVNTYVYTTLFDGDAYIKT